MITTIMRADDARVAGDLADGNGPERPASRSPDVASERIAGVKTAMRDPSDLDDGDPSTHTTVATQASQWRSSAICRANKTRRMPRPGHRVDFPWPSSSRSATARPTTPCPTSTCRAASPNGQPSHALGWGAASWLAIYVFGEGVVVFARPGGTHALGARGHLRLPASMRHACRVGAGDRLLLVALVGHGLLLVHTMPTLELQLRDRPSIRRPQRPKRHRGNIYRHPCRPVRGITCIGRAVQRSAPARRADALAWPWSPHLSAP
jgi:hypothetical protein